MAWKYIAVVGRDAIDVKNGWARKAAQEALLYARDRLPCQGQLYSTCRIRGSGMNLSGKLTACENVGLMVEFVCQTFRGQSTTSARRI